MMARLPQAMLLLFLAAFASCGYFDPLDPPDSEPADKSITWQTDLGGELDDIAYSVLQTDDGGYILCGSTRSFGAGEEDVYLVKTDGAGEQEWSKTFGGTGADEGRCVVQTVEGGIVHYVLVGSTRSFGAGEEDVYLIKTDEAGEEEWQQTFGGTGFDQGHCVQCTNDGGYVIVGSSAAIGAPDDIYLIKTDNLGSPVWSKAFSGTCFGDGDAGDYGDCGYCVRQTADLGYIVAGRSQRETTPPNIDEDACLLKTDAEGNKLWGKRFGLEYPDTGTGVEQTADGGYILSGYTRSYGAGDFNGLLIKTDASGNEQWKRAYGGNGWDRGEGVQLTSDGGFILVGMSTSWGPYEQAWLVKTDSEGIEQWDKHFGGYYEEWGLSLQQTSDEGYILAGKTSSFGAGDFDAYLVYYKP